MRTNSTKIHSKLKIPSPPPFIPFYSSHKSFSKQVNHRGSKETGKLRGSLRNVASLSASTVQFWNLKPRTAVRGCVNLPALVPGPKRKYRHRIVWPHQLL